MNSRLKILLTGAFALMLAQQADAGRRNPPANGNNPANPSGVDLGWCRGKEHCVLAQLAAPGQTGRITLYSKTSTGGYTKAASCDATGGVDNHRDGAPSKKTPAGTYGVLDTADQLTYNDRLVGFYDATYFHDPDRLNIRTTNRMAIHTGHTPGQNSHGCIRTTPTCASSIRDAADSSGFDMKIKVQY